MTDVTSSPRTDSAFADFGAQNCGGVPIQLGDITPYGRGLAHVRGDIAVKQEIANVGKSYFVASNDFPAPAPKPTAPHF